MRFGPAIALLLAITGCAAAQDSVGASVTPQPTASPTRRPSQSVPPPKNAAPPELQGRWLASLSAGDRVTLTLGETTYQIVRGGFSGRGKIAVEAHQIEFSGNDLCDGVGTYEWRIAGGTLTFKPVGARDPCPRIDVLEGGQYTQLNPG